MVTNKERVSMGSVEWKRKEGRHEQRGSEHGIGAQLNGEGRKVVTNKEGVSMGSVLSRTDGRCKWRKVVGLQA